MSRVAAVVLDRVMVFARMRGYMRLREIHDTLSATLIHLKFEIVTMIQEKPKVVEAKGMSALRLALERLVEIPPLSTSAKRATAILAKKPTVDQIYLGEPDLSQLQGLLSQLASAGASLRDTLVMVIGREDELEFSLRIPSDVTSPEALVNVISEYRLYVGTLSMRVVNDGILFKGVDTGSSWIVFVAKSKAVLAFVCDLVSTVIGFRKRQLEIESKVHELRILASAADDIVDINTTLMKLRKEYVDSLRSRLVEAELYREPGPETDQLLEKAFETLLSQRERGFAMTLSLSAPADVAQSVPPEMKSIAASPIIQSGLKAIGASETASEVKE